MSKKVLSLVLALVMVLGSFSFVSAASYTDVTGEAADAVGRLSLLGILEGYPDGTFKPEGQITRAEFAAVAVRAKGLASAAAAAQGLPTGFSDVPGTFWASGVVGTAARLGIVNGVGSGLFAPQSPVKYEEAITMLVRALGYEPAAQAKGGYPYGYLIVANEIGLLEAVKGTQGAPATRGQVAQMTDNALEIEMMVQVGYGTETKWVVSGTENTNEKYLLDELGFDSVTGRATSVNSNRKGITVTVEDEDEIKRLGKNKVSITLPAGFDVYGVEGLETKFWYKDALVIAKVLEEAKYDAFKYDEKDEELELITEDEEYEIAASKDLYALTIDDNKFKDIKDGDTADYAKIVLNDDDEVIWAQGYTFDGFVVVDEVKEDVVYSADNYDEVDVEDFIIVKDGKEISKEDLEEGDVLYYNADEEFAVVFNNSKEGKIERVYANDKQDLRFAGKNYKIAADAIYLNEEGKIGELNTAALEEIEDEDEDVVMFFNFKNEVTVVLAGPEAGTSAYYVLRENANVYGGRKGDMLALDLRDSNGAKVSFDLSKDFIDKNEDADFLIQDGDGGFYANEDNINTLAGKLVKGLVLKVTLDKDGDAKEVALMTKFEVKNNDVIEVDDSKVKATNSTDFKLQSNTVVFYDNVKEAIKLGEAEKEFSKVKDATFFVENGKVVAIVGATDADSKTITVSGLLESTSNITKLASGKYEFKIKVSGSTKRYITEKDNLPSDAFDNLASGMIINLEVGEKSGEVKGTKADKGWDEATNHTITVNSVNGKTIKATNGKEYTLNNDGIVYDAKLKEIRLPETKGEVVTIYMEGNSSRFVNYVIVDKKLTVDEAKAAEVVNKIEELTNLSTEAEIKAVRAAYEALTAAQKALVDNLADLEAAEEAINEGKTFVYVVEAYNKAFNRFDVQDRFGADSSFFVDDFTTFKLNNTTVTKAEMLAALAEVNVEDETIEVTGKVLNVKSAEALEYVQDQKDLAAVEAAKEALDLGDLTEVDEDIELPPTGVQGTAITWESSDTDVVTNAGVVNRPEAEDATVTLTATITKGKATATKTFTVTVLALAE